MRPPPRCTPTESGARRPAAADQDRLGPAALTTDGATPVVRRARWPAGFIDWVKIGVGAPKVPSKASQSAEAVSSTAQPAAESPARDRPAPNGGPANPAPTARSAPADGDQRWSAASSVGSDQAAVASWVPSLVDDGQRADEIRITRPPGMHHLPVDNSHRDIILHGPERSCRPTHRPGQFGPRPMALRAGRPIDSTVPPVEMPLLIRIASPEPRTPRQTPCGRIRPSLTESVAHYATICRYRCARQPGTTAKDIPDHTGQIVQTRLVIWRHPDG